VGLIGTPDLVEAARVWMDSGAGGVMEDENNPEFPGWMPDRGFFSSLEFDDVSDEEPAVALFETKLRNLASETALPAT
jgi:hypothetical protein